MIHKTVLLIMVCLITMAGSSMAIFFDGGAGVADPDWNTAANWELDGVPLAADPVAALAMTGYGVVVSSSSPSAACTYLDVGLWGWDGELTVESAGTLTVNNAMTIGFGTGESGVVTSSGSLTLSAANWLYVGNEGDGLLNVHDGTIAVGGRLEHGVNVNGTGHINLYGGTITAGSWGIAGNPEITCTMDVRGGTLIVAGDSVGGALYLNSIDRFTAYGGWGTLNASFDGTDTTVTATDESIASPQAYILWDPVATANTLWCNAIDWVAFIPPSTYLHATPRGGIDEARIHDLNASDLTSPVIALGTIADANVIVIGDDGLAGNTTATPTLIVDGGTLTVDESIYVGHSALGENVAGKLVVNSGTVTADMLVIGNYDGVGTLEMNGGTVTVNTLYTGVTVDSTSILEINGGVLSAVSLASDTANLSIHVAGGIVVTAGDQTATFKYLMSIGTLTTSDGSCLSITYDVGTDETTVAVVTPKNIADINGDCLVDLTDFSILAVNWLDDITL